MSFNVKNATSVALKVLKDPSQLASFISEANMLLGLSHANIVQVFCISSIFVKIASFMAFMWIKMTINI